MSDVCTIRNATILPPRYIGFGYVWMGVQSSDGRATPIPIPFASTDSVFGRTPARRHPTAGPPPERLAGRFLWGGVGYGAFGHWLTETFPYLASVSEILDGEPELKVMMVLRPGTPVPEFGALHEWFARKLPFALDRIILVTRPTCVDALVIPPDPFGRRNQYAAETIATLDRTGVAPARGNGRKLFLSRRNLPGRSRSLPGIERVEALFAAHGYEVICPEALALDDQASLICGASEIAGENGSALHWSLYSPHVHRVISLGWRLKQQVGICRARGQAFLSIRRPILGPLLPRQQSVPLGLLRRRLDALKPV